MMSDRAARRFDQNAWAKAIRAERSLILFDTTRGLLMENRFISLALAAILLIPAMAQADTLVWVPMHEAGSAEKVVYRDGQDSLARDAGGGQYDTEEECNAWLTKHTTERHICHLYRIETVSTDPNDIYDTVDKRYNITEFGVKVAGNPYRYVGQKITLGCSVALIWDTHWFTANCTDSRYEEHDVFVSWPTTNLNRGENVWIVGKVLKPMSDTKGVPLATIHGTFVGEATPIYAEEDKQ
jgi:hypothetical protein